LLQKWFYKLNNILYSVHVPQGLLVVDERLYDFAGDVFAHVEVEGFHDLRVAIDDQDLLVVFLEGDGEDFDYYFGAVDIVGGLIE
jgi:hypothetical protein